ncbi:MAG TPA: hypothetical protein VFV05_04510 [Methylomirabilota bacterium]|nr:hypothetical protein [Methylomirabilota bacterium]
MLDTEVPQSELSSKLEVSIGVSVDSDPDVAIGEAAGRAGRRLGSAIADFAVVVTAGIPARNPVGSLREILGQVSVAGGAATALLTDHGLLKEGALVVCVTNADGAASGVAATAGRDVRDAGQAAARLVLAGWPFRARYPRGMAFAFARPDGGDAAQTFLASWRDFMGPKMRTVCTVLGGEAVYGRAATPPLASVACVEAPYASGIGYTDALPTDGVAPTVDTLVHGAADAMLTAVKRLEGRPPRLVLAIESDERQRLLGPAFAREWAAMRSQLDDRTPCVGWVGSHVAAFGRGVQPTAAPGALVVVTLADAK